ncbi:MAG: hypothetical protein R3335_07250 [Anaerolineales bacterium]|nr:hypothetical protein [Anaerolineales bacterium]
MDVQAGPDSSPHSTALLVAEFNYLAQSAFQANEDRARVSQFFFVTFGTLIAALLTSQIQNIDLSLLYLAFAVIFSLLGAFGALTLYHLARLRQAWREAVFAMNQIKDEAVRQSPELAAYFRWNTSSIPPAFKARSVGFLLAVMVALLGGLAIGAAVAFYSLSQDATSLNWTASTGGGLLGTGLLLAIFYYLPLRE